MSEEDYEGQALANTGSRPRQQTVRTGGDKNERLVPLGGRAMAGGGGVAFRRNGTDLAVARLERAAAAASNVDTPPKANGSPKAVNVDTPRSVADTHPIHDNRAGGAIGDNGDAFAYEEFPGLPKKEKKGTMRTPGNVAMIKQAKPTPERFAELRKQTAEKLKSTRKTGNTPALLGDNSGSTRTQATQLDYAERGKKLMRRFRRETDSVSEAQVDPVAFAQWFLSRRPELSPSTYRAYKQGVLTALANIEGQAAEDAAALIENAPQWDSMIDRPRKPVAEKVEDRVTNAKKAKHLSYEDWFKLDAYLSHKAVSDYANHLREWLRAGLATGLRPDEWKATEVASTGLGNTYLFVMNAKNTNGRANGEMRTIDISGFTARTISAIRYMSDEGLRQAEAGTFEIFQNRVSQALYRADSALFTARKTTTIALYTCRHQFILNMRAAGKNDVEISALVGHLTTETQTSHYGKRGKGWSPDKLIDVPDAIEKDMSTVRQEIGFLERRRQVDEILGPIRGVKAKRALRAAGSEGSDSPSSAPGQPAPETPEI